MTAAAAPMRPRSEDDRPGAIAIVLFVAAMAIAGLVTLAVVWSGAGPYADLARDNHVQQITFISVAGGTATFDLPTVVDVHGAWSAYVTGGTDVPPQFAAARFTDDEYRHMADVRRVFDTARFLVPVGLFVMIIRLQRARAISSRAMWRLLRDGSLIAAILVTLIGVVAVVAFEPLFLAFHYVFFPQGNFLFDPGTSNLVRLYPDWYWEGMSVRVGISFIAVALGVAAVAHLRLRRPK